ncbi:hypothetical protein KMZ68_18835 [Bradyrhizobium sediminis]|uniref:DUF6984 domain-containing protein n=1 Tax=Bradyrhizobium sediminis TaxID=2840469 RepID=A0A975RRI1_9BRAD|nr:hypothetical protein [Bradyrhizobium sediminis]QWG17024.1 hypothetical protein KMZ68_18835 [Bradyrhizobium sediminis]
MSANRPLRSEEIELITAMISESPKGNQLVGSLSERLVEDMKDGGMGSLRFSNTERRIRKFGKKIAEAEFDDEDGVLVSATINVDDSGTLFELDIWKVDFSPLKRYPKFVDIRKIPI